MGKISQATKRTIAGFLAALMVVTLIPSDVYASELLLDEVANEAASEEILLDQSQQEENIQDELLSEEADLAPVEESIELADDSETEIMEGENEKLLLDEDESVLFEDAEEALLTEDEAVNVSDEFGALGYGYGDKNVNIKLIYPTFEYEDSDGWHRVPFTGNYKDKYPTGKCSEFFENFEYDTFAGNLLVSANNKGDKTGQPNDDDTVDWIGDYSEPKISSNKISYNEANLTYNVSMSQNRYLHLETVSTISENNVNYLYRIKIIHAKPAKGLNGKELGKINENGLTVKELDADNDNISTYIDAANFEGTIDLYVELERIPYYNVSFTVFNVDNFKYRVTQLGLDNEFHTYGPFTVSSGDMADYIVAGNVYNLDWKEFDAVSDYAAYSDENVKQYQMDHPNTSSRKIYSVPVSVRRDALIQILNDDVKSDEDMQVIKEAAYAWETVKKENGKYVIKHAVSNPYGTFIPVAGDFAVSQNEAHGKYSGYECGKEPVKIESESAAGFLDDYEDAAKNGKWYYTPNDVSANDLENVSWVDEKSGNYCGYEKFDGTNMMEIFLACEQGILPIEQENKETPCTGWEATDYWKDCHTEFTLNVTPGKDTKSIKSNEGHLIDLVDPKTSDVKFDVKPNLSTFTLGGIDVYALMANVAANGNIKYTQDKLEEGKDYTRASTAGNGTVSVTIKAEKVKELIGKTKRPLPSESGNYVERIVVKPYKSNSQRNVNVHLVYPTYEKNNYRVPYISDEEFGPCPASEYFSNFDYDEFAGCLSYNNTVTGYGEDFVVRASGNLSALAFNDQKCIPIAVPEDYPIEDKEYYVANLAKSLHLYDENQMLWFAPSCTDVKYMKHGNYVYRIKNISVYDDKQLLEKNAVSFAEGTGTGLWRVDFNKTKVQTSEEIPTFDVYIEMERIPYYNVDFTVYNADKGFSYTIHQKNNDDVWETKKYTVAAKDLVEYNPLSSNNVANDYDYFDELYSYQDLSVANHVTRSNNPLLSDNNYKNDVKTFYSLISEYFANKSSVFKDSIKRYSVPFAVRKDALIEIDNDDINYNDTYYNPEVLYSWNHIGQSNLYHSVTEFENMGKDKNLYESNIYTVPELSYGSYVPVTGVHDFVDYYDGYNYGYLSEKVSGLLSQNQTGILNEYKNYMDGYTTCSGNVVVSSNRDYGVDRRLVTDSSTYVMEDRMAGYYNVEYPEGSDHQTPQLHEGIEPYGGKDADKMEIYLVNRKGQLLVEQEKHNSEYPWETRNTMEFMKTTYINGVTPGLGADTNEYNFLDGKEMKFSVAAREGYQLNNVEFYVVKKTVEYDEQGNANVSYNKVVLDNVAYSVNYNHTYSISENAVTELIAKSKPLKPGESGWYYEKLVINPIYKNGICVYYYEDGAAKQYTFKNNHIKAVEFTSGVEGLKQGGKALEKSTLSFNVIPEDDYTVKEVYVSTYENIGSFTDIDNEQSTTTVKPLNHWDEINRSYYVPEDDFMRLIKAGNDIYIYAFTEPRIQPVVSTENCTFKFTGGVVSANGKLYLKDNTVLEAEVTPNPGYALVGASYEVPGTDAKGDFKFDEAKDYIWAKEAQQEDRIAFGRTLFTRTISLNVVSHNHAINTFKPECLITPTLIKLPVVSIDSVSAEAVISANYTGVDKADAFTTFVSGSIDDKFSVSYSYNKDFYVFNGKVKYTAYDVSGNEKYSGYLKMDDTSDGDAGISKNAISDPANTEIIRKAEGKTKTFEFDRENAKEISKAEWDIIHLVGGKIVIAPEFTRKANLRFTDATISNTVATDFYPTRELSGNETYKYATPSVKELYTDVYENKNVVFSLVVPNKRELVKKTIGGKEFFVVSFNAVNTKNEVEKVGYISVNRVNSAEDYLRMDGVYNEPELKRMYIDEEYYGYAYVGIVPEALVKEAEQNGWYINISAAYEDQKDIKFMPWFETEFDMRGATIWSGKRETNLVKVQYDTKKYPLSKYAKGLNYIYLADGKGRVLAEYNYRSNPFETENLKSNFNDEDPRIEYDWENDYIVLYNAPKTPGKYYIRAYAFGELSSNPRYTTTVFNIAQSIVDVDITYDKKNEFIDTPSFYKKAGKKLTISPKATYTPAKPKKKALKWELDKERMSLDFDDSTLKKIVNFVDVNPKNGKVTVAKEFTDKEPITVYVKASANDYTDGIHEKDVVTRAEFTLYFEQPVIKDVCFAGDLVSDNAISGRSSYFVGKKFVAFDDEDEIYGVQYKSSNSKVLAITKDGFVTAAALGKAKVTATSGKSKRVINVEVVAPAENEWAFVVNGKSIERDGTGEYTDSQQTFTNKASVVSRILAYAADDDEDVVASKITVKGGKLVSLLNGTLYSVYPTAPETVITCKYGNMVKTATIKNTMYTSAGKAKITKNGSQTLYGIEGKVFDKADSMYFQYASFKVSNTLAKKAYISPDVSMLKKADGSNMFYAACVSIRINESPTEFEVNDGILNIPVYGEMPVGNLKLKVQLADEDGNPLGNAQDVTLSFKNLPTPSVKVGSKTVKLSGFTSPLGEMNLANAMWRSAFKVSTKNVLTKASVEDAAKSAEEYIAGIKHGEMMKSKFAYDSFEVIGARLLNERYKDTTTNHFADYFVIEGDNICCTQKVKEGVRKEDLKGYLYIEYKDFSGATYYSFTPVKVKLDVKAGLDNFFNSVFAMEFIRDAIDFEDNTVSTKVTTDNIKGTEVGINSLIKKALSPEYSFGFAKDKNGEYKMTGINDKVSFSEGADEAEIASCIDKLKVKIPYTITKGGKKYANKTWQLKTKNLRYFMDSYN